MRWWWLLLAIVAASWLDVRKADARGGEDETEVDPDPNPDPDPTTDPPDPTDPDPETDPETEQPVVTSGGLFTLATFPVSELERPLTMTQQIGQFRLGIGTDISSKGAFASAGGALEASYGVHDNLTVFGGLAGAYNGAQFRVYAGFEGALAYDTIDIRLAANVHRNAIPVYAMVGGANLPTGDYEAGGVKASIELGLPFRYALRPEIAIVALQTLVAFDLNGVDRDFVHADAMTTTVQPNGPKPDLEPSLGIATNPIPQLSLVAFAQLKIPDFDTSPGAFQIPMTARLSVSLHRQLDLGLELTLLDVKPPAGQSPFDNRFLSAFVQGRLGK